MERSRLEAEYKKMKVQKKSMEKLAIEAKQTALRVSNTFMVTGEGGGQYSDITSRTILNDCLVCSDFM